MRNAYTLLFFLLAALPLSAQIHLEGIRSNPILQGLAPQLPQGAGDRSDCPPEIFGAYFVQESQTLTIEVDTLGLGQGTLTLVNCEPIDFGTANLVEDTLVFVANPSVAGGVDTVCVEFCPLSGTCDTLLYPIIVRRANQLHVLPPFIIQAEEFVDDYCVDEGLLPGELVCNQFVTCGDDYDGEGQQIVYFDVYSTPTACFNYKASRFAGDDKLCYVLCDEFNVCDTFAITFRIQNDTLALPFFDDFSGAPGPYPSADFWLDKDLYVNNTFHNQPPSVGLATFDGLNASGSPYFTSGRADRLTSKYIDLSNTGGDTYLKFYLSPKGLGLYPNEADSLVLEFRDNQGNWDHVLTFPGIADDIPIDSVPPFVFYAVPVTDNQYLYKGFQFRFVNFVRPTGLYDIWHIDYIWLNDNEGDDNTFDDVAFTQAPPNFLKNYTSLPWWHFEDFVEQELNSEALESSFFNHFDQEIPITESAILLRERITGIQFPGADNVVDGADANIPPKEHVMRSKELSPATLGDYKAVLQGSFIDADKVELEMEYRMTVTAQQAVFFRNDTVKYLNRFDNYFAYDDGSAESFVFFDNPQSDNPILAVQYRANVEDSLRAVQFHFPHINGDAESQLFNLFIWVGSLDSEPVYEQFFVKPLYTDSKFDTLQGFSTYRLKDILGNNTPVFLPEGTDFYIGFQQVTITNFGIPIGFDLNNNFAENVFFRLGEQWQPLPPAFQGAVQIRAVVGDQTPVETRLEEPAEPIASEWKIFPNPSAGQVFIETEQGLPALGQFSLYDVAGKRVSSGNFDGTIDLAAWPNGFYWLSLQAGNQRQTEKILLLR